MRCSAVKRSVRALPHRPDVFFFGAPSFRNTCMMDDWEERGEVKWVSEKRDEALARAASRFDVGGWACGCGDGDGGGELRFCTGREKCARGFCADSLVRVVGGGECSDEWMNDA